MCVVIPFHDGSGISQRWTTWTSKETSWQLHRNWCWYTKWKITMKTVCVCAWCLMLIPSGKPLQNYGRSPFSMGKSTICMAMFNSHVSHYQRIDQKRSGWVWKRSFSRKCPQSAELKLDTSIFRRFIPAIVITIIYPNSFPQKVYIPDTSLIWIIPIYPDILYCILPK